MNSDKQSLNSASVAYQHVGGSTSLWQHTDNRLEAVLAIDGQAHWIG